MTDAPRRQLKVVLNQAAAEPNRLLAITEGESDRDALKCWRDYRNLPLDVYVIGDFDVELSSLFHKYGGNKGRIITVAKMIDHGDRDFPNFLGLVDVDLDDLLDQRVSFSTLLYTRTTSLFCHVASVMDIEYVFKLVFRRTITTEQAGKCVENARKFLHLRAALAKLMPSPSAVNIKRYCLANFAFDWVNFEKALAQKNRVSLDEIQNELKCIRIEPSAVDYHFFLGFLWHCAKRERILPSSITLEEIYRAFFHRYFLKSDTCPTLHAIYDNITSIRKDVGASAP